MPSPSGSACGNWSRRWPVLCGVSMRPTKAHCTSGMGSLELWLPMRVVRCPPQRRPSHDPALQIKKAPDCSGAARSVLFLLFSLFAYVDNSAGFHDPLRCFGLCLIPSHGFGGVVGLKQIQEPAHGSAIPAFKASVLH